MSLLYHMLCLFSMYASKYASDGTLLYCFEMSQLYNLSQRIIVWERI